MTTDALSQPSLPGDLYQAGGDQYLFSAHAESGGAATVVNNLFLSNLERRWTQPTPPALERDAVPRAKEMQDVLKALDERASVAITGQAAKAQALAVQGAPGVGKTTLAQLLALQLADDERYRDGVIWQALGPDFRSADQAQAILRTWAGYATGFFGLPANLNQLFVFEPEAVRGLLAEHARLLVVLDNVWSLAAIQPLRQALPPGAHLLITTRLRELAANMGSGLVEVGLLSQAEALALFELRLGWRPADEAPGDGWAADLMNAVGFHALGLDVALGVLRRYGDRAADWQQTAQSLIAAVRRGEVERLHLGEDDPGHNVKAVILFSYDALPDDETRRRLRGLAAFAPEAGFSTALAAAAWGCAEASAFETLTGLANAALLDRLGGGAWRQHGLLAAFGAALLRDAGERDAAAAAHARAYGNAMRAADDEQRHHEMLPAMPQLRHAFAWAAANDLELALDIAATCANVQRQFGLTREAGEWSKRLLTASQAGRAGPATLARAYGHRANILSDLATLPGEDRRQRLYDALAAYDDALRFRRPDNAPLDYAQTQNNRATILRDLATLPGEDRRQRLYDALAAYDDALRFSRPDNAPLAYATTQNNRAILLSALATLPGEDRRQRLYDALAATDDALRFSRPDNAPLAYATTQNNRANILSDLATLPGEDRRQRLYDALACSVEAVTLFEQFQQAQYLEVGKRVVRSIRDGCGDDFAAMWAELGLGGLPDWLREEAGSAPGSFIAVRLVTEYQALLQAADAEQPQVEPWRAIVALGERLLAMQPGAEDVLDWDGLREAVANDYNILGRAHDGAGNPAAALAAFARAVALQPDFAMWRRNQAGTLIDLGRLDEAAAAMARARALEPDAPRLAQLEGQLAAAREHAGG
jgi:hypothetical protein